MTNLQLQKSRDLATTMLSQDHHTSIVSARTSDLVIETQSGEVSNDTPTKPIFKLEMGNDDELALMKEHVVEDSGVDGAISKDQPDTSTTTLPYNNGYGDFCFGTDYDRQSMAFYYGLPFGKRDQAEDVGSGIDVLEFDGFQRRGQFPFFKLPKEIREKSYGLLVRPYVRKNSEHAACTNIWLKQEHLEFSLQKHSRLNELRVQKTTEYKRLDITR